MKEEREKNKRRKKVREGETGRETEGTRTKNFNLVWWEQIFVLCVRVGVSYQKEISSNGGLAKGLCSLKEMW